MLTHRLRLPRAGLAVAAVLATSLIGAGTAAAAPSVSVVVKGLNSPRHLTFGPGGHLYVAIAGVGGSLPHTCESGLGVTGNPTKFCAGEGAAVDTITLSGATTPLLKTLPSIREVDNGEVTGVRAVTFHGNRPVLLFGTVQSSADGRAAFSQISGSSGQFGYLFGTVPYQAGTEWHLQAGADISGFAATHPQSPASLGGVPGETRYDSDPHDVVPYKGGYAVADAGANDVVSATLPAKGPGRVSVIARFPTTPQTAPAGALGPEPTTVQAQAVPSSLAVGPDGALYVGVLRGIPGLPGTAAVYRVVPGQAPVAVVTGLTRVSDLAFTKAGKLLILEQNTGGALAPPDTGGALLAATPDGTAPVAATDLHVPGLVDPDGLAVGSNGAAYIADHSTGAHKGEIVKVTGIG